MCFYAIFFCLFSIPYFLILSWSSCIRLSSITLNGWLLNDTNLSISISTTFSSCSLKSVFFNFTISQFFKLEVITLSVDSPRPRHRADPAPSSATFHAQTRSTPPSAESADTRCGRSVCLLPAPWDSCWESCRKWFSDTVSTHWIARFQTPSGSKEWPSCACRRSATTCGRSISRWLKAVKVRYAEKELSNKRRLLLKIYRFHKSLSIYILLS